MGRIVAFSKWDELTLGTNCRFLEFGTNCRLGRIVAWDELSPNQSETREVQSFGAKSGASAAKPQPSSSKIKLKALIVFF